MGRIKESELVLNRDGSIYHLHLHPEDIAENIILVGDPGRVEKVSRFFERIEITRQNREFITHTGYFQGKRITALSTGIGTDNIDIVLNELDALVNIDLKKREVKATHTSLNLIRIGTTGAIQPEIPVDSWIASGIAAGFDNVLHFYGDTNNVIIHDIANEFVKFTSWNEKLAIPYFVKASNKLLKLLADGIPSGITISAPGFYGPQGRSLRLPLQYPGLNEKLEKFRYNGMKITNYEMESSAIYGLSGLLGHNSLTLCAVVANRSTKSFSTDYEPIISGLIEQTLIKL
jgi:uridine phosphorylase